MLPSRVYFNPTPPEAAILLGVRFSPFREVTPLFPNQEASYERTRTVIGSHSEGRRYGSDQWIVGLSTAMVEMACWRARLPESTTA